MQYFMDRLKEPGTLRSLAVALVALTGLTPEQVDAYLYLGMLILAGLSAAMPEKGVKAVAAVQEAAGTARDAAELAVSAAAEAKAVTGKVAGIVEGLRS